MVHFAYSVKTEYKVVSQLQNAYVSPLLPPIMIVSTHTDSFHPDIKALKVACMDKFIPRFIKELSDKPYVKHLIGMSEGIETALKQCLFC